jgi:hypothetical protein
MDISRSSGALRSAPLAWVALACALLPAVAAPTATLEDVREAALVTHIHGITDEIAEREVGAAGIPHLLTLLRDPDFPRRDNVVAFLAHLGGPECTDPIRAYIDSPTAVPETPEEDRALLLAPQALGRIARRGDPAALALLLEMSDPVRPGGSLDGAVTRGSYGRSMQLDLAEAALRGLGLSGHADASARLSRFTRPPVDAPRVDPRFARAAEHALERFHAVSSAASETGATSSATSGASGGGRLSAEAPTTGTTPAPAAIDPAGRAHSTGFTYGNHAQLQGTELMTDAILDAALRTATIEIGREDFTEDVACCIGVVRSGTAGTFGTVGDGLDVIDTQGELNTVLVNLVGRFKVVRQINFCGGSSGSNIIGCGRFPGNGITVVRLSGREGTVWAHEYGHNVGLAHDNDNRYIMNTSISLSQTTRNNGLFPAECDRLHNPDPLAQSILTDVGVCADADGDLVVVPADTCPDDQNFFQSDGDGDGIGTACDNCPGAANPGQEDLDGDGEGNACDADDDGDGFDDGNDNCPLLANPGQQDGDGDGVGDDCDNCIAAFNPSQSDADGDGEGDACEPCIDSDGDGFGDPASALCTRFVPTADCNDSDASRHPMAFDRCDNVDNDCSGQADDAMCQDFAMAGGGNLMLDGVELALLGRSFTLCSADPLSEPWAPVDYDNDGCIDGNDLAILASLFGCGGTTPACN